MNSVFFDDRDVGFGDLRGVSVFDYNSGEWVDEVATVSTPQKGPTYNAFRIGKDVSTVELLLEVPMTTRTAELSIECFLGFAGGSELISEAFDGFPY